MKAKEDYPTPREQADNLYDRWGLLGAEVEAFEGMAFKLPPSRDYWKQVQKELKFFKR